MSPKAKAGPATDSARTASGVEPDDSGRVESEQSGSGPRQSRISVSFVVAVIGLALSIYLTVEHFTSASTLACPEGQTINCTKVTTSEWSSIFGIPVAPLGLAYFVVMTLLVTPMAWARRRLDLVRIVGAVAGTLMVLWLIFVELFRVNALCLWCTGVHLCTVALLGLILWRTANRDPA